MTIEDIETVASDVTRKMREPMASPKYLTAALQRFAGQKLAGQQPLKPIAPTEGQARALPAPAPIDVDEAVRKFQSWGKG